MMKIKNIRKIVWLFMIWAFMFAAGCHSYIESTPMTVIEGDNLANYHRVFNSEIPKNVEILNSVIIDYSWRPGVITSDDWEFEIIVPQSWIDKQIETMKLCQGQDLISMNDIVRRKSSPLRAWYAPKPIESYYLYSLCFTSIPYVHMLVDKEVRSDGRYHIFISKH